MNRADRARALCNELRIIWLEAGEQDRETISAEIAGLTHRGALSLTELAEHALEGGRDG